MKLGAALVLCAATALAQAADPNLKIDNEYVRVKIASDAPLAKTPLHKHELDRVMVHLTDVDQEIVYEDGRKVRTKRRPGDVGWSPTGPAHIGENFSKHAIRTVEIELKKPPSGKPFTLSARDAMKVNAKLCKIEIDNPSVRVFRCKYPAGVQEPMHEHLNPGRVTVALNDADLTVKTEGAADRQASVKTGDAIWSAGPVVHGAKADRDTVLIVVDLK